MCAGTISLIHPLSPSVCLYMHTHSCHVYTCKWTNKKTWIQYTHLCKYVCVHVWKTRVSPGGEAHTRHHNSSRAVCVCVCVCVYSHACMFVCIHVWGVRTNQRHTRHHHIWRMREGDLYMRVCVLVLLANPSTVPVCLSVHVRPCVLMLVKYSNL
jgi:hypothetical protein